MRSLLIPLALLATAASWPEHPDETGAVDFERDVAPILQASCVRCHGEEKQKAGLRLDSLGALLAGSYSGKYPVIVPGEPDQSELWLRLSAEDDARMPAEGEALAAADIDTIRRWIAEGARGASVAVKTTVDHWAYRAPVRPTPPAAGAGVHPVDAFVRARLAREGLAPSDAAHPATLLRRVSLDLTGLPPTLQELSAFLSDDPDGAFDRAVDRLLASPHYGEHMARRWLDLARYADTNGYEKDQRRTMYLWRDWVIAAFNDDMPFDRFTIEQLAGDLLPDATPDQLIATGFHRNTMINREGGTDDEEFRVDAVVDRVNTTATVWLGSTLACAQCHDHKYDPFSQREYYELFAFLNSTEDTGRALEPKIPVPTPEQAARLEELREERAAIEAELTDGWPGDGDEQAAWEEEARARLSPPPAWEIVAPSRAVATRGSTLKVLPDGSVLASGKLPFADVYELVLAPGARRLTALRLEAMTDDSLPGGGPGRDTHSNFVLSKFGLERWSLAAPDDVEELRFLGANADYEQRAFRIAGAIDTRRRTGWGIADGEGRQHEAIFALGEPLECDESTVLRVSLHFRSDHPRHAMGRVRLSVTDDVHLARDLAPAELGPWRSSGPYRATDYDEAFRTAFAPEPDGAGDALAWVDQDWAEARVHTLGDVISSATFVARTVTSDRARTVTGWFGSGDGVRAWLNGELVLSNRTTRDADVDQDRAPLALRTGSNELLIKVVNGYDASAFYFDLDPRDGEGMTAAVLVALFTDPEHRDRNQRAALERYFRRRVSERGLALAERADALERERAQIEIEVPYALVMNELAEPRETHVHERGSFLSKGAAVEPGVPGVLHDLEPGERADRLALARWLVDPANPLTARVTVNRLWEQLFGTGLVATSDDFGTRGDPPSHPELLDWLAVELVEGGWSIKHVLRTIVTSAAYRQSSSASAGAIARDPRNRLLARGPRFRVPAETVRDVALVAAGLLDRTVGGPSVFPYQPDGVWTSTYSSDTWSTATDSSRLRRGMYTFWRRTSPYPTFLMFDATSREVTCSRRSRTNTPLQALALLNDRSFVEAAVGLARRMRMMREAGRSVEESATLGFRLCVARAPDPGELDVIVRLFEAEREHFAAAPEAAALLVSSPDDPNAVELAAWVVVANALLNLDETVTKG